MTAGDMWRAPARRLIKNIWRLVCRKQATKNLDHSPMAKKYTFFQVWDKSVERRGQPLAPYVDHGCTCYLLGGYVHSLALPDMMRVSRGLIMSISKVYRRVSLLFISVLTMFNVKTQIAPRAAK